MPGIDLFFTPPNGTSVDFSFPPGPLPAGFFDPGSDPFGGAILLTGQPLLTAPPGIISPVDTIVERLAQATLPVCGSSDTIPIEIVALSLTSSSPIVVTYNGGMNPELWDIDAALSSLFPQNLGSMTINHDGATCGTFTAVLPVTPKLVFTRQSDFATRTLDLGIPLVAYLNLPPTWIANSVLLGSLVFTVLQVRISYRLISPQGRLLNFMNSILPLGSVISIALCWLGIMTGYTLLGGLTGLIVYSFSNRHSIKNLFNFVLKKFT